MPRSRGSDLPQRQSPRGPHQLRTSSSDSDPLHHRPIADRSPKLGDRRSPRSTTAQSDNTLNQKKLGTRIADLESQLGQAQKELKNLKDQLSSAEAAKKEAQEKLVKKADQSVVVPVVEKFQKKRASENARELNETENKPQDIIIPDNGIENHQETDVFEVVPIEKVAIEFPKPATTDQIEKETQPSEDSTTPPEAPKPEMPCVDEMTLKNDEIALLKCNLEEKMKELESMSNENENLKQLLNEAVSKVSEAETKEEEMKLQLKELGEELEAASKVNAEKLKCVEAEKEVMESEMKKLRVQTEQWRKAADAAAAVLAGDVDMRIPERCGSMDKHFETPVVGRYNGYVVGSPGVADDFDDGFGGGKKKGSGIRMFGDLWKKRGQK